MVHGGTRDRLETGLSQLAQHHRGLFLSDLPIRPPYLSTIALCGPHSFSLTVTKSPRKEVLSLDVERRLPRFSAGPGPGPGVGAVRRTASGP